MFLSPEELEQMTECTRRKRSLQIAWLEKHKIPYTRGKKGGINVLRAYVERLHGLKDVDVPRNTEPNLSAFAPRKDRS